MSSSKRGVVVVFILGVAAGAIGSLAVNRFWVRPDPKPVGVAVSPEFLADHPEILERVRAVILNRSLTAEGAQRVQLMDGKWRSLTHAAFTPTIGRPDAPRVLLEFTDYTCTPCRASAPIVREGLAKNEDVRTAILPLPIGGAVADYIARIAVAAYRQSPGKFPELHTRLMESRGALTQDGILDALHSLKFDVDQVERESQSEEIKRYLEQVRSLSEDMKISAVPAFAMGNKLVLGAVSADQVQSLLYSDAAIAPSTGPSPESAPRGTTPQGQAGSSGI